MSGADAAGFLRAVFVELLVSGPDGTRVVIGRDELNLLFGDRAEELPWHAFLPRLQVCELLEEAIEHLEMDIWMTDAERANEDLTPGTAGNVSRTYWFASPGEDSDVVFQTLRRADGYNLAGLMFGTWPHGITIPMTARITEARSFSPFGALPLMPVSEAMARLSVLGSGGSAGGNGTRTD